MSYNPKEWDLSLSGDTFNALKSDFNAVLRKTLSNMETKSSELTELTVKLKITLKKERAPGAGLPREVVVPKFDHKVSSIMQIKDELTGSLGGNYELVWDKDRGEYVMREIMDPQQSLFDYGFETVQRASGENIVYTDKQPLAIEQQSDSEMPEEDAGETTDDGYEYDEPGDEGINDEHDED